MTVDRNEVTRALSALSAGDEGAVRRLLPMVYDEFRAVAGRFFQREPSEHTLQPTALVHEVFMRLVDQSRVEWRDRSHFFAIGAQAMRRILVNHARDKQRQKRGGAGRRVELSDELVLSRCSDEDVLVVEDLLQRLEAEHGPTKARIVELRFFGGLTLEEIADVLHVSKRTVEREWTFLRAWLRRELAVEP